jgi:hypothetical protein
MAKDFYTANKNPVEPQRIAALLENNKMFYFIET